MIPATIVTGFLGSGKTTLLNRLLRHADLRNSLVIINEFGEVGIDHLVVSAPAENVRLLANGCMCCQMKGELVETLTEVARKRELAQLPSFDRLYIETSGLADPVPILHALVSDSRLAAVYRMNRLITVIDALHFHAQFSAFPEARKQAALADLVLLSKTDLVPEGEIRELGAVVRDINPGAEIVSAAQDAFDPGRLLREDAGAPSFDIRRWLGRISTVADESTSHRAGVTAFCISLDEPVRAAGLATWLSMLASLKGPQLLRVKGIVNVAGEPYIVDVVQSVIHPPFKLDAWPDPGRRSCIVFIGRGLTYEDMAKTLPAFALGDSLPSTAGFDPRAYADFRRVADRFVDLNDVTSPRIT